MISLKTMLATAVCFWSEEDEAFVVETPLFPRTAGVGDSEKEARQHFEEMLTDVYDHYANGNVLGYNKAGRPAKGGISLHASVRPDTKVEIDRLAKALNISQGEVIDFAIFAATHTAEKKEELRERLDTYPAYPKRRKTPATIAEATKNKLDEMQANP
jgi:hypothetical protein